MPENNVEPNQKSQCPSLGLWSLASQVVSAPEASCLPALVVPAGQAAQAWLTTFSFTPHCVASHLVLAPDASWLPVLVFPAGHVVHTLLTTFSFGPHLVASHRVPAPEASWLPVLVLPAGQVTHVLPTTFSLALHIVACAQENRNNSAQYNTSIYCRVEGKHQQD